MPRNNELVKYLLSKNECVKPKNQRKNAKKQWINEL